MTLTETLYKIKSQNFWREKIFLTTNGLSVIFLIISCLYILVGVKSKNNEVPLHYNFIFGIDSVGNWKKLFLLPLIGLIILVFNNLLANFFYRSGRKFLFILLISSSALIQLILSLAIFWIIRL
ncbi:MAG: hypothetical protein AAB465_00995 [Patescibacteria group bacterium]